MHTSNAQPVPDLVSPDRKTQVRFELPSTPTESPRWSATFKGNALFTNCRLSLSLAGEVDPLARAKLVGSKESSSNRRIRVLCGKSEFADDKYRETRLSFESASKRRFDVVFRCYDDAIAFRYEIPAQKGLERVTVSDEGTSFQLSGDPLAYVQYLENYQTSHEHNVTTAPLGEIKTDTLLDMPATFAWKDGTHIAITEAALRRYAGMSLMRRAGSQELVCKLTPRPDGTKVVTDLPMKTPWRVAIIGDRPGKLLESNVIYCLNDPSEIGDTSWIKPGKMTWSWWNGNVVKDGKAEPPIFSLEAQRTYIDFCAANDIAFHSTIADNSDTPWYKQSKQGVVPGPDTDVTQVRADLDLTAIRKYAESRGVRLWTWVHQAALRGRVEEAFTAFEQFGWSGMMVDFFDHDDQESVQLAEDILKSAARHNILIHFHGIWKPTGLQRTYPNLMNHEGALNLEYLKWSDRCTPEHSLLLALTRLVAGPMDYHAGGFRAVRRDEFKPQWTAPNVLGSRAHHLAMYVCFDNPNPMVADYPGAYEGQPGFEFIKMVPTWWDETRVLAAEAGELLVTVRRKGTTWYVGGMAAKSAKDIVITLGFLGSGRFRATLWKDGPETKRDPNDIQKQEFPATKRDRIRLVIAPDGGFVARFEQTTRK